MTNRGDQPRGDAAERDTAVHREALQRVRGRTPRPRRQAREQRRLRGPERAAPEAPERIYREGLPRRVNRRHERERDRHDGERGEQHPLRADAIGERSCDEAAQERRRRLLGGRESGKPERDPADVVEIDEEKRQHDAVPERVDERAELEHVDIRWQSWVEASQVVAHAEPSVFGSPCQASREEDSECP
jgi:hypothetical protein